LTAPDGTKICVVVFISASTAPEAKRAALIADVARAVVESHTKETRLGMCGPCEPSPAQKVGDLL
jgi:hypothetical protein